MRRRRPFEDRLERELVAAALRQAGDPGGEPPRGRGRAAVGAVAAVTALAAIAAALVVGPLDGTRPATTGMTSTSTDTLPIPRSACDAVAAQGNVTLTTRALPRAVPDAFALLRRPQTARDRADCAVGAGQGITTNPAELRYAKGPGRWTVRLGTRWKLSRPQVCLTVTPGTAPGGLACFDALAGVEQGFRYSSESPVDSERVYAFVVPDGVAEVEIRGSFAERFPVRDNVGWYAAPANPAVAGGDPFDEYALFDDDGEELAVVPVAR
jgi:hypothetical protein